MCPRLHANKRTKFQQPPALAATLEFMIQCKQLKKATIAFNVDDSAENRSKHKHNEYVNRIIHGHNSTEPSFLV